MLGYEQPNRSRRRTVRPPGVCRGHYFRSSSPGRGELAFGRLVSPSTVAGHHPADRGSVGRRPTGGPGLWVVDSPFHLLLSAARVSRAASALRLATPLTFPFVRTLSAHLVVGAVAATTLGCSLPAMASTDRPVATGQLDAYPIPVALPRSSPAAPPSDSLRLDPFLFPLPVLHLEGRPSSSTADAVHACGDRNEIEFSLALSTIRRALSENEYRIVAGDNLWKIAQRVLSQSCHIPPPTSR